MTDLQLGLLVLGAAAVIGVVVYNRVQERSVRRDAEHVFGSRHEDVLVGSGSAHPDGASSHPDGSLDGGRVEPVLDSVPPSVPQEERAPQSDAMPDERVDYIIVLRTAVGISRAAVLEAWRPIEQRFARRALLAGSEGSGWRRLVAGDFGSCTALRAALQLVSRSGVVGDAELLEFRSAVETLAARIGASVVAPEMRQALDAARALDKRCAEADIQVALHVVGELDESALDAALAGVSEAPYQLARRADGLTLILDVPRSQDLAGSYAAMKRRATHLASTLGGRVVDDRGNALDERSLAAIGAELEPIRRQLSEHGIEPGSPLALRLFS
jgi:ZipA, C-terminal FtsZ-binding domain